MLASFAYAVLQLLLDGAYAWGWQSMTIGAQRNQVRFWIYYITSFDFTQRFYIVIPSYTAAPTIFDQVFFLLLIGADQKTTLP